MSEDTLWTWLKKARKSLGEGLHMRRVENSVTTGDADVDGIILGMDFAIELKACKRPARNSTRLDYHEVTDQQVEWHSKRWAAGGASIFLIQVGEERYAVRGNMAQKLQDGINMEWLWLFGRPVTNAAACIEHAAHQRKESP